MKVTQNLSVWTEKNLSCDGTHQILVLWEGAYNNIEGSYMFTHYTQKT